MRVPRMTRRDTMRLLMVSPDPFFQRSGQPCSSSHFCESTDLSSVKTDWRDWLAPIQQKWYEQVEEKVREAKPILSYKSIQYPRIRRFYVYWY